MSTNSALMMDVHIICVFLEPEFKEKSFIFGHVYFRQQKDPSIQRGYLQKSLVLLTRFPFVSLFREMVTLVGSLFFDGCGRIPEISIPDPSKTVFWNAIHEVNTHFPHPKLNCNFDLQFFGKRISYRSPVLISIPSSVRKCISQQFANKTTNGSRSPHQELQLKERLQGRKYCFQSEVNIYRIFANHMNYLFQYWELLITGEPILILSPRSSICCDAALALCSLIAPLEYNGDYRPYFTVHNSDFKIFGSMGDTQGFTPTIVGVTNPFFVKIYEKWPHIIAVGKVQQQQIAPAVLKQKPKHLVSSVVGGLFKKKTLQELRNELMWEFKETFISNYSNRGSAQQNQAVVENGQLSEFVLCKDLALQLKKSLIELDERDVNCESADIVNNEQIRKTFEKITESFLSPLHMCFDTILHSMKTFVIRSEHSRMFKPEKFYNYICKTGYDESIFGKTPRALVLDFYKRFIYSINFRTFIQSRIKEAYYNDLIHTDFSKFLSEHTNLITDVALIDLFLRIKQDLEQEKRSEGYFSGDDLLVKSVCDKLHQFLEAIVNQLPDNLRMSLSFQSMKTRISDPATPSSPVSLQLDEGNAATK